MDSEALAKPVSTLKTKEAVSFMSNIREKFPMYSDIPDDILLQKVVKKYPAYSDIAEKEFGSISKPDSEKMNQPYPIVTKPGPVNPIRDALQVSSQGIQGAESLATGQGIKSSMDVLTGKKQFKAGEVETNALRELGLKGNEKDVTGGPSAVAGSILGTILDAWPMIVDPAVRMGIASQVKNGNMAAAEFQVKKFLKIPQETNLATISPEELIAKGKLGKPSEMSADIKSKLQAKTGKESLPQASSVISYVKDGKKIYTKVSPEELTVLKDEVSNIPNATQGESQIHLDANTSSLKKIGQEVSREEFIRGHSQAGQVLSSAKEPMTKIEGSGETKPRGLSLGVEEKAIENKLTRGFAVPEYEVANMQQHAIKASELLRNNPEQAKRIAMGEEHAPEGMIPEAIFIATENKAITTGDVETIRSLATRSRLLEEATTMGQRIRTLGERDPESPIDAIKDIMDTREKVIESRLKGKKFQVAREEVVADIRNEVRKMRPKDTDWARFVASLKC